MFKGLGNIAQLIKQAQNIGPKMEEMSQELQQKRVTGSAGGGMITVHANGLGQILSVEIDPLLEEKADFEMVRDLLPAAINQAVAKSKELHVEAMKSLSGGLPLPGGLDDMLNKFSAMGNDLDDETKPDGSKQPE